MYVILKANLDSAAQAAGMQTEPEGIPAAYGRACTNCSKDKHKCVLLTDGNGCQRCFRLKKDCRPSETVRKRKKPRNGDPDTPKTRTAKLEHKLDNLMAMLQAKNQGQGVKSTSSLEQDEEREITSDPSGPSTLSSVEQAQEQISIPLRQPTHGTRAAPSSTSAIDALCSLGVEEAEKRLEAFRIQMAPRFPFVHIPSSKSAQQLRTEQPFLFAAILAVSSASPFAFRLRRGIKLRDLISRRVYIDLDANLDVLLGLLVLLAWGHDHFFLPLHHSRFTQMAISMVYDLRLSKPFPKETNFIPQLTAEWSSKIKNMSELGSKSLVERRAVLGCYILSSEISAYFTAIDPLRWTPFMEESLKVLETKHECQNDLLLVYQARLQVLAEKAMQMGVGRQSYPDFVGLASPPPIFYYKALRSSVDEVKRSIPSEIIPNETLQASIHYAEMCISELPRFQPIDALGNSQTTPMFASSFASSLSANTTRITILGSCVTSIQVWLDTFFRTTAPQQYTCLPLMTLTQLSHCIVTLYKLTTLEDVGGHTTPATSPRTGAGVETGTGWDRTLIRQQIDLIAVLDRIVSDLRAWAGSYAQDNRRDDDEGDAGDDARDASTSPPVVCIFVKMLMMFESIRNWCALQLAAMDGDDGDGAAAAAAASSKGKQAVVGDGGMAQDVPPQHQQQQEQLFPSQPDQFGFGTGMDMNMGVGMGVGMGMGGVGMGMGMGNMNEFAVELFDDAWMRDLLGTWGVGLQP